MAVYPMTWYPTAIINQLKAGDVNLGIFFTLKTTPPLNFWLGTADIIAGIDSVTPDGTLFLGGGRLIGVPTLEQLVNGKSDKVIFTISGVDAATGQTVLDTMPDVRYKNLFISITTLDTYFQPVNKPVPLWKGYASHQTKHISSVSGNDARTMSIDLTVVAGNNTRARSAQALWSYSQQLAKHPGDLFCKNTGRIGRGFETTWPRF
jgi:hypothetical protein